MNYHNIETDNMLNGSGLRVCLWLSGCTHNCNSCQNKQTWNPKSGIEFDSVAEKELFDKLSKEYISGITFTGGDPLHKSNCDGVYNLILKIRNQFGSSKNIWLYTGYSLDEELNILSNDDGFNSVRKNIICLCNVVVDGRFEKRLVDVNYPWAGSTNQKVINVKESISNGKLVLL